MQKIVLSLLKTLGLAYWISVIDADQNRYTFGPFASASHAVSLQERCCQALLEKEPGIKAIRSIRGSMEA